MAKKKSSAPLQDAGQASEKRYVTLRREASAEMTEKKSVFIGHACPVRTPEEAIAFISKIRARYPDATHNVYAYMIGANVTRYSDDGEPGGTAGMPVLEIIRKGGFTDAAIVVTRYFGGILLGAGGLVRAYSAAARLAADAAEVVTYIPFTLFTLRCTYADFQKLEAELPRFGVRREGSDFSADVTLSCAIPSSAYPDLCVRLSEMSAGRIVPVVTGSRFDA